MKKYVIFLLLAILALLVAFGGVVWRWYSLRNADPDDWGSVPAAQWPATTAKGPVPFGTDDLAGHPWVAGFIFTHCSGPCPILSTRMAALQKVLSADVRLVTFTVDPDRDTLPVLARYAARYGADPSRWFFVRLEKDALYPLMFETFRLPFREDPQADSGFRVTHSTKLVLVDGQRRIRGYFDSTAANHSNRIVKAVRRLERESQ